MGPDSDAIYPNPALKRMVYVKNVVTNTRIIVGDYTYYDDPFAPEKFEDHVTHHYEAIGDKLIIGKFCAIASGVEFVMNGANHPMKGLTTYPFHIFANGWENIPFGPDSLSYKGDTVIENDVWIGQNATIMPGVHIGNGAIIGANATVASDIPAYAIAVGNPARVVKMRFDEPTRALLEKIAWWNWPLEKINQHLAILTSGSIDELKAIEKE